MLGNLGSVRENRLDSLSNNCFSTITLSVILGFSGLGDTLVEGTMKKRDMGLPNLFEQNISLFFVVVTTK